MKLKISLIIEVDLDKAKKLGSKATLEEAKQGLAKMAQDFCNEISSPPDDQYIYTYYEITEIQ